MARHRAMVQSSRPIPQERPATPIESLPLGADDSVPPPGLCRSTRRQNASATDAQDGPEGVHPHPAPLRRSKRLQAPANASARDAAPSVDGASPEVSKFPLSLPRSVMTMVSLGLLMVSLTLLMI